MERLCRPARDEHHGCRAPHVRRRHRRRQDGEGRAPRRARRHGRSRGSTPTRSCRLALLDIEDPTILCRATDHIAEQIEFIADIEKNGFAYVTADGVYFDTSRSSQTTATSRGSTSRGQEAGKRVDLGDKRIPPTSRCGNSRAPGEKRADGMGQPVGPRLSRAGTSSARRWRRSTSATTSTSTAAGEDHIPVHHTNEIAQTEARVGTRLANFWMHGYFLTTNDAKMAKSSGDFLRIGAAAGSRLRHRLPTATSASRPHYRSQMSFTWEALDAATDRARPDAQRRSRIACRS
jgi:cysteinyl-tRNA synthetase